MSEELKSQENNTKKKRLNWTEIGNLVKTTFVEYFSEATFRHAAALAYYAVFSLIPMIYLGVYFFGRILGNETVHLMISDFLHNQVGMQDVSGLMDFLKSYDVEKRNPVMEIVGIVTLLFASSAFVVSLRKSISDFLDIEPGTAPVKKMILRTILSRLLAIAFIGIFGVIILLIYVAQTVLISIGQDVITNSTLHVLFSNGLAHFASLATNFLIFTMMFKYIHDAKVKWKAAMFGALITAVLVYLGQVLIKFYLTNFFFAADGGVVGSIFVILAWIFYTSQILFLGAKFVKVYSEVAGIPVRPKYKSIEKNGEMERVLNEDSKGD
jgi:membrane protein